MIKKLLVLMLFVSGLFAAQDFTINYTKNNDWFIKLDFSSADFVGEKKDNWIGIYKQGDTNDWENVVAWSWARDLRDGIAPGDEYLATKRYVDTSRLKKGAYELRFFKNNSYIAYDTYTFWIDKIPYRDIVLTVNQKVFDNNNLTLKINATYADPKTWIGIFKNGVSNDWENVIDWSWVASDGSVPDFDLERYTSGQYNVRLFFHNTYIDEKTTSFRVSNGDVNDALFYGIYYDAPTASYTATLKFLPSNVSQKDWIGLFEKGSEHSLKNLVAWSYVKGKYRIPLLTYQQNLIHSGEYDVVYFTNDSYFSYGKIHTQRIQETIFKHTQHSPSFVRMILPKNRQSKDWVGMFKHGKSHTRENLLAWNYVSYSNDDVLRLTFIGDNAIPAGVYDYVYFKNDTYTQRGITGTLTQ